jgi:hypothetical protein
MSWRFGNSSGAVMVNPTSVQPNVVARFVADHPNLIEYLRAQKQPGDRGAGDTLARLFGRGGMMFQGIYRVLGGNCGCKDSQIWLNGKFPW